MPLGREFDDVDDGFWFSVFLFFIIHPSLAPAQVEPVVEFLHDQRFAQRPVIIGEDTEVYVVAPQPDLCLKGWTVGSLLRRAKPSGWWMNTGARGRRIGSPPSTPERTRPTPIPRSGSGKRI